MYQIIDFDVDNAQITVQADGVPSPFAVDVPISDDGTLMTGADLDQYIRGFIPVQYIERREKIARGLKNAAEVEALVRRPPPPPAPVVPLPAYNLMSRGRVENEGVLFNGVHFPTDGSTRLRLAAAAMRSSRRPGIVETVLDVDGNPHQLAAADVVALSDAMSAHVDAVTGVFVSVKAGIEAGSITTEAEVDAAYDVM